MRNPILLSFKLKVLKGSHSVRYYGAIIWNVISAEMKYVDSLETCNSKIRMWRPNNCPISLMLGFWKHLNKLYAPFLQDI